jgi:aspartyl-tRNA(Asn)/glutamyl-tRNA(Gln) amidotransferase subunit A
MTAALPHTARDIRDAVSRGEASAVEICRRYLDRIQQLDSTLGAFRAVAAERALEQAATIDRTRPQLPLAGVPIAIKDNLCTRGLPTTASSRILQGYLAPYDATVVTRLQDAGAIIVGKTNCDEFAMGSSTENSAFGPSRNPWDFERIPGGSSGGSAVAVAAGLAPVALGSDTGGSIRQPAAMCGIFGLKPTYGRVSRYGLLAFASSLDQIGPMSRSVYDAALLLNVIAGPDQADSTAAPEPVPDFTQALTGDIRGLRVGIPSAILDEGVDADVRQAFFASLDVLRGRGATLVEIELPHARYAIPTYYLIATAEASSNLARYDGVRYGFRATAGAPVASLDLRSMYNCTRDQGFGAEVKRRIILGTYVLSAGYYDAYYLKAQQVRTLIRGDYETAFERADVVAMPTSPTPAFKLGERLEDPLQMYLNDVFTVSANLAGLPAISVPCGFAPSERSTRVPTRAGVPESGQLPIGLQLTGRMFDEATLLRVADAYQRDSDWWKREPVLQ